MGCRFNVEVGPRAAAYQSGDYRGGENYEVEEVFRTLGLGSYGFGFGSYGHMGLDFEAGFFSPMFPQSSPTHAHRNFDSLDQSGLADLHCHRHWLSKAPRNSR